MDGRAADFPRPPVPDRMRSTMRAAPVDAATFAIPAGSSRVRVIETVPAQLITHAREEEPAVVDGLVVADPARDLAKIAVIERHHATGRVGLGLVRGFGLTAGAFASTVAHDAHNLVVVGVADADMAACATRLQEIGGGIAVARGGAVRGDYLAIDLPPNRDYETVAGYVLSHMHHLPATGEWVDAQGWRFEVVDLDGRRIDKVLASRLPVRIARPGISTRTMASRQRGGVSATPSPILGRMK